MQGVIGQVRGFDLEKYLSEYDEPGSMHPWSIGNDSYIPEETQLAREADRQQRGRALGGGAVDLMAPVSDHSNRLNRLMEIRMSTRSRRTRRVIRTLSTIHENGCTWPTATRDLSMAEDAETGWEREKAQGGIAEMANEVIPQLLLSLIHI